MQRFIHFSVFCFLTIAGWAQENTYNNFTVDDGLPSNMVYCVQQDSDGFIWFGTDAGISKYDGYEFTNYTLEDGLPDIEILHFFKDSQSRIWFYSLNGKVGFLKEGSIFSSKNTDWLLPLNFENRITSIVEKDSKLYFSSVGSQIKILDDTDVSIIDLDNEYRLNSLCLCDNELLIISISAIFLIKQDYILEKTLDFEYRELIYPFCFKNKIYAFNRTTKQHGIVQISGDSLRKIGLASENYILNFEEHDKKMYLFRRNGVSVINDDSSLGIEIYSENLKAISSMLIDQEGNSWLTSIEKGVYFKPQSEIKLRLDAKYVTALESRNDELLVAHDKLYVSTLDQFGVSENFATFENHNRVNLIHHDHLDNLWIVRNNGVFLNGEKISIAGGFSLLSTGNSYFLTGRSNAMLSESRINAPLKKYKLESYGLSSVLVSEDSILIGTDNGLLLFNKDKISNFVTAPLLNSRITNLILDDESSLWIGTGGNGLIKYNDKGYRQISKKDGLTSDIIDKMLLTDSVIWLSTPQGINKINISKGKVEINKLDRSNGLKSYKINDLKLFGKEIFLATNDGLYSFPLDIDLSEPNNFKLYIDKVLVDNIKTKESKFQYNIENVQLHFKALSYRNHSSLIYQYQLNRNEAAIDSNRWLDTKINQVNFSKIATGNYYFYVRAKTKNSKWSPPLIYEFKIIPAFWQRTLFQTVVVLLLASLIGYIFYQINASRLAKKNLEKEKLSAELKALKAQINPHFLFNVLNSIQSFILENEKDIAQEYLVKYGRLMRMVLDHSDLLVVSLSSELEMLKLYTDLEMLRLKKGFNFEVILSDYFKENSVRIPSMVIQPFIENAIWHGLSPLNRKGRITLALEHYDDYVEVKISDDGVGIKNKPKTQNSHKSSGVRLVEERLNLIQSSNTFKNYLEIVSQPTSGTCVILRFSDTLH